MILLPFQFLLIFVLNYRLYKKTKPDEDIFNNLFSDFIYMIGYPGLYINFTILWYQKDLTVLCIFFMIPVLTQINITDTYTNCIQPKKKKKRKRKIESYLLRKPYC